MSNTFITVIAIMSVALIMFIFPLMATANQNDNITQTSVQTIVSDFVNRAASEAKITQSNYDEFIQKLYATGNTYSVELEVLVLDDNPGNKGPNVDVIGENIYYSVYTSTIEEDLDRNQVFKLKQGDYVKARVRNTNVTFGTQMKNFLYSIIGKDTIAIEASASALVTGRISNIVTEPNVSPRPPEPEPEPEPVKQYCSGGTKCITTWCIEYEEVEPSYSCEHEEKICERCGGTGEVECDGPYHEYEEYWYTSTVGNDKYMKYVKCITCDIIVDSYAASSFGERDTNYKHTTWCRECGRSGYIYVCPECGLDCKCDEGIYCSNCELIEEIADPIACEHGVTGGHYTCRHYEITDLPQHTIPCIHGKTEGHYY